MTENPLFIDGREYRVEIIPPVETQAEAKARLHPSVAALLRFFDYAHLPEHLQWISQPFHDLAHDLAHNFELDGAELTAVLRKLLEAKDCAVRAALS